MIEPVSPKDRASGPAPHETMINSDQAASHLHSALMGEDEESKNSSFPGERRRSNRRPFDTPAMLSAVLHAIDQRKPLFDTAGDKPRDCMTTPFYKQF